MLILAEQVVTWAEVANNALMVIPVTVIIVVMLVLIARD